MKKIIILFLVLSATIHAQKQEITLEDIWIKDPFNSQSLEAIHSMNLGDSYPILNPDSSHGNDEGNNTRLHLNNKMTKFIDRFLGESKNKELEIIN